MKFYVLSIGGLTQYKFAWAEAIDQVMSESAPRCPACHSFVGMLRWLPPHTVWLYQPRRIGDFTVCIGGADFIVSAEVIDAWTGAQLVGWERTYPVQVVRCGSRGVAPPHDLPSLTGVDVCHSACRVDYQASGVRWAEAPQPDYCRVCGPGGGASGGSLASIERIVVEEGTWRGEDMFQPINLSGTVLLSERAAALIEARAFSNCAVVRAEDWQVAYGIQAA